MNYDEAVRYLLTLGRELAAPTQAAAAKFDLENIRVLAERLGQPQRAYPTAHVAGTDGKGCTAALLESSSGRAGTGGLRRIRGGAWGKARRDKCLDAGGDGHYAGGF